MLDVFITIDTEVWWHHAGLDNFRENFELCYLGRTAAGDFGVPYQIEVFNRYGLRAVFLVEALFASAVGPGPLEQMVEQIQGGGHDVQLHLHTEWLPHIESPVVSGSGEHVRNFGEEHQVALIGHALENLRAAGAEQVCAFRAGNYGADNATLRALARNGLLHDTSYNHCYLATDCGIRCDETLLQPRELEGVLEYPISFFEDRPGHHRHAQLVACSFAEMRSALEQTWQRGWQSFVIVSHSFELLNALRTRHDPVVVRRFDRLCRYLAENSDKYRTSVFDGSFEPGIDQPRTPLSGNVLRTAWRTGEQLARRLLYTR